MLVHYWKNPSQQTCSILQYLISVCRYFIAVNCDQIVSRVHTPDGIAVDWVGKKVYWTDGGYNMIEVAELDGSNRLTLFSSGLDEPRAIVVDPLYGLAIFIVTERLSCCW